MRYGFAQVLVLSAGVLGACSQDGAAGSAPSALPGPSTGGNSGQASGGSAGAAPVSAGGGGAAGAPSVGTGSAAPAVVATGQGGNGPVPSLGSGGSLGSSGSSGTGGLSGSSGSGGSSATGGSVVITPAYVLPPPSQCHNQDFIDVQEGCKDGDPVSTCGGKCSTINACQESSTEKPNADVTFICPRVMLFSDAMLQAAIDDGNEEFNYAVVGHDVDQGGIDGDAESTCCQCYQLVYAYPSPQIERQAQANPDNPDPPASALAIPKPLIVQSFNTAATPHSFDVFMAAGGFGANNACAPGQQPAARSGQYLYTSYPTDGQSSQGGVKPVSLYPECKTDVQWVTTESLSGATCQSRVAAACGEIESNVPGLTEQARRSCIQSNSPASPYHLNWSVYAMKVECPQRLTDVTGCKLAPQGLPTVDGATLTAAQAAANAAFFGKSTQGVPYETTTMEDCCRPSCASKDWVEGRGLVSEGKYNAFYSCDVHGVPLTE